MQVNLTLFLQLGAWYTFPSPPRTERAYLLRSLASATSPGFYYTTQSNRLNERSLEHRTNSRRQP